MSLNNKMKDSTKNTIGIILFFMFLSVFSVYFTHLYNGEIIVGDDFQFHKNRIEGLFQSLNNHIFFPKMNMLFMNSMGYASSIFYSDLFIYFPAILRFLGLSLAESYTLFIIVINFATFLVAYISKLTVTKNERSSLMFSLLYTLSSYRLLDLTTRAALGELLAICFLPLAFLGIYQIIYGDTKKWYHLTLGMTLIIHAHILSAVMFSMLILLFLVFNIRNLFNEKKRIKAFIKAVLLTVPLVLSYFLPILEQIESQTFKVSTNPIFFMSEKASHLGSAFLNALSNKSTPNIGIILVFFIIFYFLSLNKIQANNTKPIFFIGILFLILTTDLFPWKLLDNTFLNTIQFPWRFLAFATLLISWVASDDSFGFFKNKKNFYTLSALIVMLTLSYTLNLRTHSDEKKIISYEEFNQIDSYKIGAGKEYLPDKANFDGLKNKRNELIYDNDKVVIKNYHKNENVITFDYKAQNKEIVTIPFIYYKGYVGEYKNNNGLENMLFLNENEDGLTSVELKGTGTVKVYYKNTLIQKLSLSISLVSYVLLICLLFIKFSNI